MLGMHPAEVMPVTASTTHSVAATPTGQRDPDTDPSRPSEKPLLGGLTGE